MMDALTEMTDALRFIKAKLEASREYSERVYGAISNQIWVAPNGVIIGGTWRFNGALIANMAGRGEGYMDYYCCGTEGHIADDVRADFERVGIAHLPTYYDADLWRDEKADELAEAIRAARAAIRNEPSR